MLSCIRSHHRQRTAEKRLANKRCYHWCCPDRRCLLHMGRRSCKSTRGKTRSPPLSSPQAAPFTMCNWYATSSFTSAWLRQHLPMRDWTGAGWAKGKKHQNIRAVFPMYTTYFQMYALKKSGIKSIKDFNAEKYRHRSYRWDTRHLLADDHRRGRSKTKTNSKRIIIRP